MKKIITFVVLLVSSILTAQDWQTNFEEAKSKATKESKNIILVFSGSDWCAPCIKLEKTIWQSDVFAKESAENWVLLKADFPKKKNNLLSEDQTLHNAKLAEKYNPEGSFPKVVILNSQGKILGILGYEKISPEEYISKIKSFQ